MINLPASLRLAKQHLNSIKLKKQRFHQNVWNISSSDLKGLKYYLLSITRVILLSRRGFNEDQCFLRAMALTYFTLLSLVPFAAMAFGIAKGFGLEKRWESLLLEKLGSHETVLNHVLAFSKNLLMDTKGGLIAGFGIFFLFWSVIKVFTHIENSFNAIWGIKQSRTFYRKITDYLTLMLVCPVLFIAASSTSVYAVGYLNNFFQQHSSFHSINPLIFSAINMISFVSVWSLFSFLYLVIPNTRVRFDCAFFGGLIAGTAFILMQKFYVYFQLNMTQFNAIYGSFAALPLFLIWLQSSWILVLLGAEISFAVQNLYQYEYESESSQSNHHSKLILSIAILKLLQDNFDNGFPPLSKSGLIAQTQSPFKLMSQTLRSLQDTGYISKIEIPNSMDSHFQLAKNISGHSLPDVIHSLQHHGIFPASLKKSPLIKLVQQHLMRCHEASMNSEHCHITLNDIKLTPSEDNTREHKSC